MQEKQEGKLKKILKEAKKTIAELKAKIESLVAELATVKEKLAQYKSALVSSTQRIWSNKTNGSVNGFAPMKMWFLAIICGRVSAESKEYQAKEKTFADACMVFYISRNSSNF